MQMSDTILPDAATFGLVLLIAGGFTVNEVLRRLSLNNGRLTKSERLCPTCGRCLDCGRRH